MNSPVVPKLDEGLIEALCQGLEAQEAALRKRDFAGLESQSTICKRSFCSYRHWRKVLKRKTRLGSDQSLGKSQWKDFARQQARDKWFLS